MKTRRVCEQGHVYYKTTDCPTCPVCEKTKGATGSPFDGLGGPARRALQNAGITTVKQLAGYNEAELLRLHGIGPASMPLLKKILSKEGLRFSAK